MALAVICRCTLSVQFEVCGGKKSDGLRSITPLKIIRSECGQIGGVYVSVRRVRVSEAFAHLARAGSLSLTVLIGGSHSSVQIQAEEREERTWLDSDYHSGTGDRKADYY